MLIGTRPKLLCRHRVAVYLHDSARFSMEHLVFGFLFFIYISFLGAGSGA